ncbi:malonate decarboxylase subunit alpha [Klebsiella pneumoniae]|nr:malonate decarboxylase subunit alpha [Klebsiella pneumoniae]
MRSNRAFCQLAGQYAVDMFIGSTLQVDGLANSSTVTRGRLSGFGGAPNMGPRPARSPPRHPGMAQCRSPEPDPMQRGKKLVVQMVETFQAGVKPTFVETLDAVEVAKTSGMPLAPVMIYGDDVTHVLTEEGIAYLYRAESLEERRAMVAAVAGIADIGLGVDAKRVAALRQSGKVWSTRKRSRDSPQRCHLARSLLAAGSIADLVEWSDGLYNPPAKFRSW